MISQKTLDVRMKAFRSRCAERGLSLTHQRWVIYRVLAGTDQHPTPEATFEEVRKEIPPISLATIYNNINVFLKVGLLRSVSTPSQAMRLDANLEPHHHFLCEGCGAILDFSKESLAPMRWKTALPRGVRVDNYSVSLLGRCGHCAQRV
jgi:Fur family peroxide stress response transcriptional regulator